MTEQAWRDFNRLIGDSGDVGIWHQTYLVRAGEYESLYGNMPRFGLAAAGSHSALDHKSTAARRLGRRDTDQAPVKAY